MQYNWIEAKAISNGKRVKVRTAASRSTGS